jgi:membrane fusion protein (multidrug efflux system)
VNIQQNSIIVALSVALVASLACDRSSNQDAPSPSGGGPPFGAAGRGPDAGTPAAAVPVRTEHVPRRSISQYLQTNGTLEAENEVDLVARTSGPVTEILTEEGRTVRAGELMARIDEREPRNQAAIARVARDEAQLAFDRTEASWNEGLVSREAYDSALSKLAAAGAQLESAEIQLAYTEIRAPFDALVVTRNIRLAQYVTPGTTLFRISDFTPLLCRVEVPEKDFQRIRDGQQAHIEVEAFPDQRFPARVARLRPTVDPASGTFTVTLEVEGHGTLRPGMFATVYLETATHDNVLVIPRNALVLDSLGDTVYVMVDGVAERREVKLGLRDADSVEVLDGLAEGEPLIVLGQEGLAEGTPVTALGDERAEQAPATGAGDGPPPEAVEAMRQRMRERGLSDEQIEARLEQMREAGASTGAARGAQQPGSATAGLPPFMVQRIKDATPDELERIKERMKEFGMSDDRINEVVTQVRGDGGGAN